MDQEQNIKDILEIVSFLKDNMVTKNDLEQRLTETKSEILTHLDGFVGLHQKLDVELVAMRAKYERLESYILQLARHAKVELQG